MSAGTAGGYIVAAVMLALALLTGVLALALGRRMRASRGSGEGGSPPEHGGTTAHKSWVQFRVRYPVLALLFVAFDMEMVYMFPWAVVFKRVGLVAFLDMFVFIAILVAAIAFAWKEGAFDWED